MSKVAEFARSDTGQMYATTCERYGLDPAVGFADDVLAFNLRAALLVNAPREEEPDFETKYGGLVGD
jgi:hypothetical protein